MEIILKKPIVNEKFSKLNEKGVYGFIVSKSATKPTIKAVIEKMYDVKVVKINTVNVLGKTVTRMSKSRVMPGKKQNYKKAYVTLQQGQVIDFYNEI
ncbi:MAG: 50S ribosomal protein L23 [Flexibacteraceae bacterium]|jgi:large subunit ribosomal protein L23